MTDGQGTKSLDVHPGTTDRGIRHAVIFAGALSVLTNAAALVPTVFLLQVYDRVLASRSLETLWMLVFISLLAYVFSLGVEMARGLILSHAALRFGSTYRQYNDTHAARLAASHQLATSHSVQRDIGAVELFLSGRGLVQLLDLPWAAIFLLVIFLFDTRLGAVALAGFLIIGLVAHAERRHRVALMGAAEDARASAEAATAELTWQASMLAQAGRTTRLMADVSVWRWRERVAGMSVSLRQASYALVSKTVVGVLQTAMLATGALLVIADHASGGIMLAATLLLGRALQPMQALFANWQSVQEAYAAWPRLQRWVHTPLPVHSAPSPAKGPLVAEAVNFGHRVGAPLSLIQASLRAEPAQVLSIIGGDGSGKTTLGGILSGQLRPMSGAATLDGIRVDTLDRSRHSAIAVLTQESWMFAASVAANIAGMHSAVTDGPVLADIEVAARMAGIHDWILSLPQGYATVIGRGGHYLTHAEQRFVELARTLCGCPHVVVLDEPSARFDDAATQRLETVIRRMTDAGMIVVLLAVRPPFDPMPGQVLTLHQGRLSRPQQADPELAQFDHLRALTQLHRPRPPIGAV